MISRNYFIKKLFEEHTELVDANRLEGEDPDICKWLKKRYGVIKKIKKFDKKLQKAEDPEDYRSSRIERLIDILEKLLFELIS